MIRVAPYAVEAIINDDKLFDLEQSARQLLTLREGNMLGNGNVNLTKITPQGIMLVAENGDINLLPIDYVPERPFTARPVSTGPTPVPEITPGTLAPEVDAIQPSIAPIQDATDQPVNNLDAVQTTTNGS